MLRQKERDPAPGTVLELSDRATPEASSALLRHTNTLFVFKSIYAKALLLVGKGFQPPRPRLSGTHQAWRGSGEGWGWGPRIPGAPLALPAVACTPLHY